MKIIRIGRDIANEISFDDPVISRRHALLKIYPSGKMEIIASGQNGTFLNGKELRIDVPYVVRRTDVVSFAHVRTLDWSLVPNVRRNWLFAIGAVVALIVIFAAMSLFNRPSGNTDASTVTPPSETSIGGNEDPGNVPPATPSDEDNKQDEKEKVDLSKEKADSVLNQLKKQEEYDKRKAEEEKKKAEQKKKAEEEKEGMKKKEEEDKAKKNKKEIL